MSLPNMEYENVSSRGADGAPVKSGVNRKNSFRGWLGDVTSVYLSRRGGRTEGPGGENQPALKGKPVWLRRKGWQTYVGHM